MTSENATKLAVLIDADSAQPSAPPEQETDVPEQVGFPVE